MLLPFLVVSTVCCGYGNGLLFHHRNHDERVWVCISYFLLSNKWNNIVVILQYISVVVVAVVVDSERDQRMVNQKETKKRAQYIVASVPSNQLRHQSSFNRFLLFSVLIVSLRFLSLPSFSVCPSLLTAAPIIVCSFSFFRLIISRIVIMFIYKFHLFLFEIIQIRYVHGIGCMHGNAIKSHH